MLSDRLIRHRLIKDLVVDPIEDQQIQPASIDLTLAKEGKGIVATSIGWIRPDRLSREKDFYYNRQWTDKPLLLPQQFALGATEQWVEIPDDLVARVEGKSSLARLGLMIHVTAGFIDPGFKGNITLELYNLSPQAIWLTPGMPICQIAFDDLSTPAQRPYGSEGLNSKYQESLGTIGSRYG